MALEVRPVASKRDLNVVIKLPWRLYRNEHNWMPPLLFERRRFFDRKRNPFFQHADADYCLAWREDRAVGRITAHADRHFNEFQKHDWGMFVFALGVKPEWQHTRIAAKFYELHFDSAARTPQKAGETGWILETNQSMNRAMEGMGGKIVRTYRVYEKVL